jgi:hypothetical protein
MQTKQKGKKTVNNEESESGKSRKEGGNERKKKQ